MHKPWGARCGCTFKYWLVFNEYPLRLTKRTQREARKGNKELKQTNKDAAFVRFIVIFKIICHFSVRTKKYSKVINHNCLKRSWQNKMRPFRGTYSPRGEGIYTLTEQLPGCVPSCDQLFSVQSILRPHEGNKTNNVHKCMHVTH